MRPASEEGLATENTENTDDQLAGESASRRASLTPAFSVLSVFSVANKMDARCAP
jgi:hypothetical protein